MIKRRDILQLGPLLLFYILIVLAVAPRGLHGDEKRHMTYATNLADGFYTDADNPEILCGPGYPVILVPFLGTGPSYMVPKLLNAVLAFLAIIYFYLALRLYIKPKPALITAYLMALYPPFLRWMYSLHSEPLMLLLICGMIFHLARLHQAEKLDWRHVAISAFYLGFLTLVKVVFAQVMLAGLVIFGIVYTFYRKPYYLRMPLVIAGGLLTIMPFIMYTYSLTGKFMYMGTQGGQVLYWRASPFPNDLGNWFSIETVTGKDDASSLYGDLSELTDNHLPFYQEVMSLPHVEKDQRFQKKAIEYVKQNPKKYIKNTIANIGRLFFHYPFSYRTQNLEAFGYMIPNMFVVVLGLFSLYPAIMARKRIPYEIWMMMLFISVYLGGMALLGGRGRHLVAAMPFFLLFMSFVYTRILSINIQKD